MKKHLLKITFYGIIFFFSQNFSSAQSCPIAGGTVQAVITNTLNLSQPPPMVTNLNYQICNTGFLTDTNGGNATRVYYMNLNGKLLVKAASNSLIFMKSGSTATVIGGGGFITVTYELGATLTGTVANTYTCPNLGSFPPGSISCPLSINNYQTKINLINIFPNPNNGSFKFQIENEIENGELILINSLGQKVHEQKIIKGENNIITHYLAAGLYDYILLQNKVQIQNGKLAIE